MRDERNIWNSIPVFRTSHFAFPVIDLGGFDHSNFFFGFWFFFRIPISDLTSVLPSTLNTPLSTPFVKMTKIREKRVVIHITDKVV